MSRESEEVPIPRFPTPTDPEIGLRALIDLAILEERENGRTRYVVRDALRSYLAPSVTKRIRRYFPDDPSTVEHLRDEALDRMTQRVHQCHSESRAGIITWATTIAQNLAIDELRRRRSSEDPDASPIRFTSLDDIDRSPMAWLHSLPWDIQDEQGPGEILMDGLLGAVVEQFAEASEMMSLHEEGHYTWEEVGQRFGISGGAAKERVRRLRTTFPAALAKRIQQLSPTDQDIVRSYLRDRGIEL